MYLREKILLQDLRIMVIQLTQKNRHIHYTNVTYIAFKRSDQ